MKFYIFCLFVFSSFSGFAVKIESTFDGDTTLSDTTAVNAFIRLSRSQRWRDSHLSLRYADRALGLAEKINYKKGLANAHNLRGFCFWAFGDNELAIEAGIEALKIAREESNPVLEADSYYTLARGYMDVSDRPKSKESINIARTLARNTKDWELLTSIYNLLGVILYVDNKPDSALFYYSKALELGREHDVDPVNFARIISNIGECYLPENKKLAFTYFNTAISLAKETGNRIAEASIGGIIGHAQLRDNKLKEAESTLVATLELARRLGLRRVVRHAYAGLVDIRLKQGRGEEAVSYLRKSFAVRDSLMNTSKIRQIVELENKYDIQLKEQNIRLLESEKRIQTLWTNLLTVSIVFLILLGIGVYFVQSYRHRKNREMLNLEIDLLTQRNKESEDRFRSAMVPEEEIESQDQKILKKAISAVEANIADRLFGVDNLATEMGMSRTSLNRKIKSITGFAPGELIRSIRLRKAAKLIVNRADSVTQIAHLVGFEDYSYFAKSFKKHFGVSPTQYNEQNETDTDQLR